MNIQKWSKNGEQDPISKRACKNFSIENGQFFSEKSVVVIMTHQRQLEIVKDVHEGVGESTHSKAMASLVAFAAEILDA